MSSVFLQTAYKTSLVVDCGSLCPPDSVLNDVGWRRVIWMQRFFCETETLGPIAQKWEISSFQICTPLPLTSPSQSLQQNPPTRQFPLGQSLALCNRRQPPCSTPSSPSIPPPAPRDRLEHRRQDGVFKTRPFRPGMHIPQEPLDQPRLTSASSGHRRPRPSPSPEPASATQRIWRHRPSTQRPLHLRRQCPPKLVRNPLWPTTRSPRPTSNPRRPQPSELPGRRSAHPRLGPDRTTNCSVPHDQGQPEAGAYPGNGGRKR